MCAAPKGNQYWKIRSKHGRDKKFTSPQDLWETCCCYFEWVEKHPLYSAELVKYQGKASIKRIPKMRAMTISGLCLYLGISRQTWGGYREDEGFSDITTRVEDVIYTQKFEGAAAEMLNPNIIARDLGLKDSQSVEHDIPENAVMVVPGIASVEDWNKAATKQQRQLKTDVKK